MIRILVVDDHAVVRQGIARLLADVPDLAVVGEGADGDDGRRLALSLEADVCVLDLAMPGGGVELVSEIHALRPRLRILVFSMHREEHFALRVLAAGASGFLSKGAPPAELEVAVRAVASGHRYLSAAVTEQTAERLIDGTTDDPHERLSPRRARGLPATGARRGPERDRRRAGPVGQERLHLSKPRPRGAWLPAQRGSHALRARARPAGLTLVAHATVIGR